METKLKNQAKATIAVVLLFLLMHPTSMFGESLRVLVERAEKDIGDLTASADLWGSQAFLAISRNANTHIDDALVVFADSQATLQQKMIVGFALQSLHRDDYLAMLGKAVGLYLDGRCPARVVELLIMPGFEWSTTIIENYRDERVVRLLNEVRKNERTSDQFKNMIDGILSGKTWEKARVFIANQPKAKS